VTLRTDRLILRPWRSEDRPDFAALNADPEVMEWFPSTMTRAESDAFVGRIQQHFEDFGWGLWAVEVPGVARFIGFIGLTQRSGTHPSRSAGGLRHRSGVTTTHPKVRWRRCGSDSKICISQRSSRSRPSGTRSPGV
jgi:hypothetical protein